MINVPDGFMHIRCLAQITNAAKIHIFVEVDITSLKFKIPLMSACHKRTQAFLYKGIW